MDKIILCILLSCRNLRLFLSGHRGRTPLGGAALPARAPPLICSHIPAAGFIDKTPRILYNPVKKMHFYSRSTPGTQHAPSAHFARSLRPFLAITLSFRNRESREAPSSPDHMGLFSSSRTGTYLVLHKQIISQIRTLKRPEKAHFFAVPCFYTKPPPWSPFHGDTAALGCLFTGHDGSGSILRESRPDE